MTKFQHLILTRFNVKVIFNGYVAPSEDWLTHRFDLFDRFCFPSVHGQTNTNFKWLVFFDNDTPHVFRKRIESYAQWGNFLPLFVDSLIFENEIMKHINTDATHIITTRLDNDDALGVNFVEIVQNNFRDQDFEFINLTNGYILCDEKLYLTIYEYNPFVSLIERINDFKSVYCVVHTQISKMGNVKQVVTEPSWLQVIHDKNRINTYIQKRYSWLHNLPLSRLNNNFKLNYSYYSKSESVFMHYVVSVKILLFKLLHWISLNIWHRSFSS